MIDRHKILGSLLRLKNLSTTFVARATGIPRTNIELFLSGRSVVLAPPAVSRIASIAGLDVSEGVLTADRVHVFHISVGPFSGDHASIDELETISYAMLSAKMVELKAEGMGRARMFAVQNDLVRALVIAHHGMGMGRDVARRVHLRLGFTSWACGAEDKSVVKIDGHIRDLVRNDDMLSIDFDEIFLSKQDQRVSFQDVQHVARGHGLSGQDLLKIIERQHQPMATSHPAQAQPGYHPAVHREQMAEKQPERAAAATRSPVPTKPVVVGSDEDGGLEALFDKIAGGNAQPAQRKPVDANELPVLLDEFKPSIGGMRRAA